MTEWHCWLEWNQPVEIRTPEGTVQASVVEFHVLAEPGESQEWCEAWLAVHQPHLVDSAFRYVFCDHVGTDPSESVGRITEAWVRWPADDRRQKIVLAV